MDQTYRNFELILIDDGSPDKCPIICDEWAKRDDRIKVIHKRNGGQSSARNIGINESKGDYIAFIDSDDWIEPQYITVLLENQLKYDADISVISFKNYKGSDIIYKPFYFGTRDDIYCLSAKESVKFFLEHSIAVMGKLYKASIINDVRFPEGRKAEEYTFQLKALQKTDKIVFCNKYLYNYLVRNDSDSHDIKSKYRVDNIQAISETLDFCKQSFQSEESWAYCWLASLLYEFYSVSEFGKEEKEIYKEVLSYALSQVGGVDGLYKKMQYPLDRIIYVTKQYRNILKKKEIRTLQSQYRELYKEKSERFVKGLRGLKYIISYINLNLITFL